jgi:IclR family KDG regulon transcriptional repressor
MALSHLNRHVSLDKATTYRILERLRIERFVAQEPMTRKYLLGPQLFNIYSSPLVSHEYSVNCSIKEMEKLRNITDETVTLYVRLGLERICLESVESTNAIKFTTNRGHVLPIHIGASGRVLLSELSDEHLIKIMGSIDSKNENSEKIRH